MDLLKVFYYVLSGLTAVLGLLPLIHIFMGIAMREGVFPPATSQPEEAEFMKMFGLMFIVIGICSILFSWTMAAFQFAAARCLGRRRRRVFCLVVAGLTCLNVPLGTVLGIFTFIILQRPMVRTMFDQQSSAEV